MESSETMVIPVPLDQGLSNFRECVLTGWKLDDDDDYLCIWICRLENGGHFVQSPLHKLGSIHAKESSHGTQD